jgi:hypothetical protein
MPSSCVIMGIERAAALVYLQLHLQQQCWNHCAVVCQQQQVASDACYGCESSAAVHLWVPKPMQTVQQQPAGVALLFVSERGICLTVCGHNCLVLRVSLTKTCALVPAIQVLVVVLAAKVLCVPLHVYPECAYWVAHMQSRALATVASKACICGCLCAGCWGLHTTQSQCFRLAHHMWPSTGYGCEYVSGIRCWMLAWCMNAVCVWLRGCRRPAAPALAGRVCATDRIPCCLCYNFA